MFYIIYVNGPHRSIRRKCIQTADGRYVLYEGEGPRRKVMELAREAADHADSINVLWKTTRTFSRGWRSSGAISS